MKLNLLTKFVNISGKHENYVEYLYLYACTITQGISNMYSSFTCISQPQPPATSGPASSWFNIEFYTWIKLSLKIWTYKNVNFWRLTIANFSDINTGFKNISFPRLPASDSKGRSRLILHVRYRQSLCFLLQGTAPSSWGTTTSWWWCRWWGPGCRCRCRCQSREGARGPAPASGRTLPGSSTSVPCQGRGEASNLSQQGQSWIGRYIVYVYLLCIYNT